MSPSLFCECRLHPLSSDLQLEDKLLACSSASFSFIYCQTEFILYFGNADSECLSHSHSFSFSLLFNVPSKSAAVTHIDLWGAVTLAPYNLEKRHLRVIVFWRCPAFDFQFLPLRLKVELRIEGLLNSLLPFYGPGKTRFHSVEVTIFKTRQDLICSHSSRSGSCRLVVSQNEIKCKQQLGLFFLFFVGFNVSFGSSTETEQYWIELKF